MDAKVKHYINKTIIPWMEEVETEFNTLTSDTNTFMEKIDVETAIHLMNDASDESKFAAIGEINTREVIEYDHYDLHNKLEEINELKYNLYKLMKET